MAPDRGAKRAKALSDKLTKLEQMSFADCLSLLGIFAGSTDRKDRRLRYRQLFACSTSTHLCSDPCNIDPNKETLPDGEVTAEKNALLPRG